MERWRCPIRDIGLIEGRPRYLVDITGSAQDLADPIEEDYDQPKHPCRHLSATTDMELLRAPRGTMPDGISLELGIYGDSD